MWCIDTMHHVVHKVVECMGGQTSKARGVHGVCGVHIFLIARNAPKYQRNVSYLEVVVT